MEKKDILKSIEELKKNTKKRNFSQSYDIIINLKDIDLKKNENKVDFFTSLPNGKGKKTKVCALVGSEMTEEAKACDQTILEPKFADFENNKAKIKRLAEEYDYFIAQANLMPAIAKVFGRVLGTRGKMPNPKAGCVVPPKANLAPLYERLQNLIQVAAKEKPLIQLCVGNEKMSDEEVAENIYSLFDSLIHHLPNEKNNIKSIYLKLTMGKPIKLM